MSHDELPPSVDLRIVRWIIIALVVLSALSVLADLGYDKHGELGFDGWFGFHAVYGFVSCVFLVLVAKGLRVLLMRPEDYYDE